MPGASRHEGSLHVAGQLSMETVTLPLTCLADANVRTDAAIDATKLLHQYTPVYAQANAAAADETKVLHVAKGAGTVIGFRAGAIVAPTGAAICTFDLKKNGTTVLSGVITLNNASVAYVVQEGTVTVPAYVAGDVFTVVVDETIGGGARPTGVFAQGIFREAAT